MKRSIKEHILRLFILCIGLIIAHLGVTLFLLTNLGADPFNVFIQGLFRTLGRVIPILTHGYTHAAVCIIIMLVLLFVDRSYIKLGALVCMAFGGPIIDVFTRFLESVIHPANPFAIRLLTLAAGLLPHSERMARFLLHKICGVEKNSPASAPYSSPLINTKRECRIKRQQPLPHGKDGT